MSYPYVIQVYAFMPLSRALTTTRSSDNTKTYLRKGENFIRTQRSTALPKMHLVYFSLSYPQNLLPICASSRLMCFVFSKMKRIFIYKQKICRVGEIPMTFLQLCYARFARALSRHYHYSTC